MREACGAADACPSVVPRKRATTSAAVAAGFPKRCGLSRVDMEDIATNFTCLPSVAELGSKWVRTHLKTETAASYTPGVRWHRLCRELSAGHSKSGLQRGTMAAIT